MTLTASPVRLPSRFRMRLTVWFVLTVGLSAGALVAASLLIVREQRYATFTDRAEQQARVALDLSRGESSAAELQRVTEVARDRAGFESVVVVNGITTSSSVLTGDDIPEALRNIGTDGVESETTSIQGEPYLVVAGTVPDSNGNARVFTFFSERDIRESLEQFRNSLAIGWVIVVLLAAAVGTAVARRVLRPVQQATNAARDLAEGLLDTRLPDAGRDEFGAWARYFNDMASALQHKIDELSAAHEREKRFTADVAHDLRTPLAAMSAAASLMEDSLDDPDQIRKSSAALVVDIRRMRTLVVDLLDLARLDADAQDVESTPVELRALVNDVVISSNWEGLVDVEAHDCVVFTDRRRVERIVSNLIANALSHGGGHAVVKTNTCEGEHVIEVLDRGPGIPPDELDSIFSRFHKASKSRSSDGSGLGLAIAVRHAELIGGSLRAANRSEGGACFRLTFASALPKSPNGKHAVVET